MAIEEKFSSMSAQDLTNLLANATRLASEGKAQQKAEAERLLPLITAELDTRRVQAKASAASARKAVKKA